MDGTNNKILWFIAIISTLTLILLATFVVMEWKKAPTGQPSLGSKQTQNLGQTQGQTVPTAPTDKLKECMDTCISGGKLPPDCLKECGGLPKTTQ